MEEVKKEPKNIVTLEGTVDEIQQSIKEIYIQNQLGFGNKPNLELKGLFDKAFDNNIVVIDPSDKTGSFTKELMCIGCNTLFNSFAENLQFIIEDTSGLFELWYKEKNGSHIFGKSKLILFVGSTNSIIGAY